VSPAPRRLVLSAADFASLVRRAGVRLPPPFSVDSPPAEGDGGPVHPSLAANLAVLARPDLLVRVDADLPAGVSRAVFAVAGPVGASLFARARADGDSASSRARADGRSASSRARIDGRSASSRARADGRSASSRARADGRSASSRAEGAVELSMFAGTWLGRELIRAVPEPPSVGVGSSLAPDGGSPQWDGRRVGRTALAEYGAARRLVGPREASAALGLTEGEADLVADLTDRTQGTLRALVHGRPHGTDGGVLVGRVVWVATDAGWFELAPSDVDELELVRVTRERIGTRLAPMIAQVLAEVDDDAA
jgi:hypothetical protein